MNKYHQYVRVKGNPVAVKLADIPMLEYNQFFEQTVHILYNHDCRCISYFAKPDSGALTCFICISDKDGDIIIFGYSCDERATLASLAVNIPAMHIYEREIAESFGVTFEGHPWLKPVRYPYNRSYEGWMDSYPFYKIEGAELHEVGVGPIHAGVIEPGHFRFICNGEKVLHLEIQLGYQHRGVETLMANGSSLLRKTILSENIAGDSAVSHGLAFTLAAEALSGVVVDNRLAQERVIAQEMERIAVHIGDTAALCGDVAYQLGQVVCEALRTVTINTTQFWCGNRFGKGLIRPAGTRYPLTADVRDEVVKNMNKVKREYVQFTERLFSLPSVLARFEGIGIVTTEQVRGIGAVGMAARMANLNRDIRKSNPYLAYKTIEHEPLLMDSGDVMARAQLRADEVVQSIDRVLDMLEKLDYQAVSVAPNFNLAFAPDSMAISLVEGWRGEICHVAITNAEGSLDHYKVKDPSFHNWFALALAVRDQEISDFPICNKSFDLSYCGNDL
jgi:Ni,Fe-hydrogenase III large subunit